MPTYNNWAYRFRRAGFESWECLQSAAPPQRLAQLSLSGVDLFGHRPGRVRTSVSRHVNVAIRIAADMALEVIPQVELPHAILAEGLAVELGVCRLAHLSAHLVFKARVLSMGAGV